MASSENEIHVEGRPGASKDPGRWPHGWQRRDLFTAALAAGTAALSTNTHTAEATETSVRTVRKPAVPRALPFKISLAQWSLHKALRAGELDPLDFAKVANGFGFDGIEYVNQFYADKAKDRTYLAELKRRAADEGVWSVLIMVDREGAMGAADKADRAKTVENHKKWVEAAAYLGCHAIRVNAHSEGSYDEQIQRAADGLQSLATYADTLGINVIVENHGGLSSNAQWLCAVMKAAAHPRCGTLPDFGNFRIKEGEEYDRYQGTQELMPYAKSVSAKSYDFDKRGEETKIDYTRMMKIVTTAGYRGYVGVEYEGSRLSEVDGLLATKKLLEKVRNKLLRTPA
ncbi:MAG: sugar phosphate isomerase/epimerase [Myxococcales bacterium]|nr:sugar phosphate isomerase/epimerase [Myxococcales bacterium]